MSLFGTVNTFLSCSRCPFQTESNMQTGSDERNLCLQKYGGGNQKLIGLYRHQDTLKQKPSVHKSAALSL